MKLGDPTHGLRGTDLEQLHLKGDGLRDLSEFWDASARVDTIRAIADSTNEVTFETSGTEEAATLLTLAPPRSAVLEIGCGVGRIMQHLAESCSEVHGVDISAEMVERGSRRLAMFENVMFHKGNGYDLAMFPDVKFDLVYSTIVFQHIPKPVAYNYMTEVRRVLKPDGVFRLQVPNLLRADDFDAFRHFTQPYFAEHPYPMHFYTPSEVAMMISEAGLTVQHMTEDIIVVARKEEPEPVDPGIEVAALLGLPAMAGVRHQLELQREEIDMLRRICDHWSVRALRRLRRVVRRPGRKAEGTSQRQPSL
jgi:ubiquinone/menaquinone biosynthesis C-methylase UbiE